MKTSVARTGFVPAVATKTINWAIAGILVFFVLLWLEAINQVRAEWSLNPQYGYGWSVPFLAVYLFWKRWTTRPTPQPPNSERLPIAIVICCAVLFLPIRFLAEANPDWRLLSWALAVIAVGATLAFLFLAGGTPWLRHFAFPCAFFLIAVPWPAHFEQMVIQNLMRAVTAINVSLLNIFGIPALRHGNVIEIGAGLIGIEEACSGVRSLQATLMISLFFGEFYSFPIARRLILIVAGAALAFLCNLVRTAMLVWIGANRGTHAIEAWHDPAGLTILLVCLFGLWLLSLAMQKGVRVEGETPGRANRGRIAGGMVLALAAWLVVAELGVQAWYKVHESSMSILRWAVQWPNSETAYKSVPITPEAESMLGYNEGGGGAWQGTDGHPWMMYFFRWLPGRTAARFVKIHRPDICLPATGMTLERDNGIRLLNVNGVDLPIRSYRFDDRGAPLHVFYCYWDARSSYENASAATEEDWSFRGRVRAALRGRREIGAQMLEIVVWGYDQDAEANAALRRQLGQIIRFG